MSRKHNTQETEKGKFKVEAQTEVIRTLIEEAKGNQQSLRVIDLLPILDAILKEIES